MATIIFAVCGRRVDRTESIGNGDVQGSNCVLCSLGSDHFKGVFWPVVCSRQKKRTHTDS